MNRLLKLQVRNLFHSKLFYICLVLSLFMSTLLSFLSSLITHSSIKPMPEIVSFLSSEIGIVTTIFVVLFTCAEFNEDTVKNIIVGTRKILEDLRQNIKIFFTSTKW